MASIRRPSDDLVSRWDDALDPGSTLELAQDDRAVLTWNGKVLAVLGPGSVPLSPKQVPALSEAMAGDDIEAELWFVRTGPVAVKFGGKTQVSDAGLGVSGSVGAFGTASVTVSDAGQVALACIDGEPSEYLQAVQHALNATLQEKLAATPAAKLLSVSTQGLSGFAEAATQRLAGTGATVAGVNELNVNLDAALVDGLRAATSRSAAPKPAAAPTGGMTCASCGAQNVSGKFCTTCGKPLAVAAGPKFCTGCGQQVKPGAKFCTGCGAPA